MASTTVRRAAVKPDCSQPSLTRSMASSGFPAISSASAWATAHQPASSGGSSPAWAWIDSSRAEAAWAAAASPRATATPTPAMARASRQAMSEPPPLTVMPRSTSFSAASSWFHSRWVNAMLA